MLFSWKVAYFLTISIVFSVHKQNFTAQKLAEMRKFQCLLFVLKQSYICYYVFCMTVPLKSKSPFFPLNKNIQTLINAIPNRKWKFAHMFLERQTLCFSSFKNCQLKVKLWWDGACEIKKGAFFVTFISSKGNCFNSRVLSECIVYGINFQNIYFSMSTNIHTSYTFVTCFQNPRKHLVYRCILKM